MEIQSVSSSCGVGCMYIYMYSVIDSMLVMGKEVLYSIEGSVIKMNKLHFPCPLHAIISCHGNDIYIFIIPIPPKEFK